MAAIEPCHEAVMSKYAERVHTDPTQIAQLETLVTQLPSEARVLIELDDGRELRGTVPVQPTVQTFRDAEQREGINSLLRLDDLADPAQQHHLWLDQIRKITRLGSY
jgi:Na+/phosphate symporter